MNRIVKALLLAAALAAVPAGAAAAPAATQTEPRPEQFYHIFVRSFADSDGDRNGDLRGLRDKLDYLQGLGVTTILLTPLYPSRFYHNYFADDFTGIDDEYGSKADFWALVDELHRRGMRIFLDEEIQYVTGQHEWYRSSHDNPASPFSPYVLYKDKANHTPVVTLLGTTDFTVWPNQQQQIYTVNLAEPKVQVYFTDYLKSWMDPNGDGDPSDGVDGFRIDHMMDDLDNVGVLTKLLSNFWAPMLKDLRQLNPKVQIIAEQADWGDGAAFFEQGTVDKVFAFSIWKAARELDAKALTAAITRSNGVITEGRDQLVFIENHDTERFANAPRNTPAILRLGAAITLLTGWTPSLYYGQEIGMGGKQTDDYAAKGNTPANADARDIPLRQAFRWVADPLAPGNAAWYRQFPDAYHTPDSHAPGDGVSVAEQTSDVASLLNTYRTLAALRGSEPALARGSTKVVAQAGDLLLIERQHGVRRALVLFNLGATPASLTLPDARKIGARRYGSAAQSPRGLDAPPHSATVWAPTP